MTSWIIYGLKLRSAKGYRYVGLSRRGTKRFKAHLQLAKTPELPVHRWMAKHDGDVVLQVLEVCPPNDWNYLCYAERYWISELRHLGHGLLNMSDGGEGNLGLKHSDEFRKRQSLRLSGTGNPWYGKTRRGADSPRFGTKNSDETRKKIRQHQLSDKNTWRGSRHRPETLQKMSEKRSEYWTPERRAQLSEQMKGRPKTPKHLQALSDAQRGKPSKGMHIRWHVNRDVVKPDCTFCQ